MQNGQIALITARVLIFVAVFLVALAIISTSIGTQFLSVTGALLCVPFVVALYHEGSIDL